MRWEWEWWGSPSQLHLLMLLIIIQGGMCSSFVLIFVSLTLIRSISQATYHTIFDINLNLITTKSAKRKKTCVPNFFGTQSLKHTPSNLRPPAVCKSRHSIVVAELPKAAWMWAQSHSEGPQTNGNYVDRQISNLYLKCYALASDYIGFSRLTSEIYIFYSLFDAQSKKKCQSHNILEHCVRSLSCLFYYTSPKKIFTLKKKKELAKNKEHKSCQSQIQLYSSTHDWHTLIKNEWVTKG